MLRPRRTLLTVLTVVTAIALAACGGGTASTSPATSGGGSALPPTPLTITAKDIAFTPATMTAPAGSPLQIRFDNQDGGVPHNLGLYADAQFSTKVYESKIMTGPAVDSFTIPGLVPGQYQFRCSVHPNMTAALTVGG